jgi:hypothetical protein
MQPVRSGHVDVCCFRLSACGAALHTTHTAMVGMKWESLCLAQLLFEWGVLSGSTVAAVIDRRPAFL